MVRFKDGGPEELWQIQSNDDGEFLVRTFNLPEEENVVTSNWKVMLDKKEENITIAYDNMSLKRIACSDYEVNNTKEALLLRDTIYEKLNKDEEFVKKFYLALPLEKQASIKNAGIFEWLTSEDILEETGKNIEESTKSGSDYREYFEEKLEEAGEGLGEMEPEEKEEFFEEVDEGWEGENECREVETSPIPLPAADQWRLAFLNLELSKKAYDFGEEKGLCESDEELREERTASSVSNLSKRVMSKK
jgi:hypothetical protein